MINMWPFLCYALVVALLYVVSPIAAMAILLWVPLLLIIRALDKISTGISLLTAVMSRPDRSEAVDWDELAERLKREDTI